MVQDLFKGREATQRVEEGERERALERSRRYQVRVQKYRTHCLACGGLKKQKECKKCTA